MNAPKILSVRPLENKKLLIKFVNGVEKIYDCTQLFNLNMFQILKNDALFKSVKVDSGGFGISWNDDADLSEYELWTNGVEVNMESAQVSCKFRISRIASMLPESYRGFYAEHPRLKELLEQTNKSKSTTSAR